MITVSNFVLGQITARGISPDHVGIVPPAVDLPDPLPPQKLRLELGLSDSATVVGSIAVLRRPKGMDALIAAMAPLLRKNSALHLELIGNGEMLSELQQQVSREQVQEQVHFLGERNDVPELIGDFDVFALATHIEASGTAIAEAGAASVPVVATDVGGVSEMLCAGESGLLVPLGDIPALTEALDTLITDPVLRQQMGRAGYKYCITDKRFVLESMGQETERHYLRWLEQVSNG